MGVFAKRMIFGAMMDENRCNFVRVGESGIFFLHKIELIQGVFTEFLPKLS